MVVDYSRGKVPRLPRHDSSHKDGTLRYAWSLDTTGDIYASNKNIRLSMFLGGRLVTSTLEALTNTLT